MNTRNLTIVFTDIKGFTDKTSHKTRAEIQHMLDKHKEIVLPILTGKGGKLVKTIGDAFLLTYESPTDAVLSGVEVQEALRAYNEGRSQEDRIEIRVAINQGEVNIVENDVYGEPVNIAARIEAIAEANEVFFTDAVYLAMNKKEVPSAEVGLLQLKGIPEKVRVYKVRRESPVSERSAADGAIGTATGTAPETKPHPISKILGAAQPAATAAAEAVSALPGVKMPSATIANRAGAVIIDVVIVLATMHFISFGHESIMIGICWYVYCLIFLKRLGTTPGGKICKVTVVQFPGGQPLEKKQRNTRAFFSALSILCGGLGCLWALWDKDGRGWHDLMAGTHVVSADQ